MPDVAKTPKATPPPEPEKQTRRKRSENLNPHTVVSMLHELCSVQRDRQLQPDTMRAIMVAYQAEFTIGATVETPEQ